MRLRVSQAAKATQAVSALAEPMARASPSPTDRGSTQYRVGALLAEHLKPRVLALPVRDDPATMRE